MLFIKRSQVLLNIIIFPKLTFTATLRGGNMFLFSKFGNIDTGKAIEWLRNVKYYIGKDKGWVVLFTEPLSPLTQHIIYL